MPNTFFKGFSFSNKLTDTGVFCRYHDGNMNSRNAQLTFTGTRMEYVQDRLSQIMHEMITTLSKKVFH